MLPAIIACAGAALAVAAVVFSPPHVWRDVFRAPEFWIPPAAGLWPVLMSMALLVTRAPLAEAALIAIQVTPLLLVGAFQVHRVMRRRPMIFGLTAGAMLLIGAAVTIAAFITEQGWMHGIVGLAALGTVFVARPNSFGSATAGVCATVVGICVALGLLAMLLPHRSVNTGCVTNPGKCELLGGYVAAGIGGGSNALAITLAMLAGVGVVALTGAAGQLLGLASLAAALASGARLATICVLIVVVVAGSVRWIWGRRMLPLVAAAAGVAAIATATVALPADAFTGRATLWDRARGLITESPLFGSGLSFWVRDAASQPPPSETYSPHNVWLDLVVAVGVVGALGIAAAIVVGVILVPAAPRTTVLLLLVGILTAGVFEATVMPFRFGPIPAGFLVLVLLLTAGQGSSQRQGDHQRGDA